MSPEINRLVSRFMKEPIQISIERPTLTVPTIEQVYYEVVFPPGLRYSAGCLTPERLKWGWCSPIPKRWWMTWWTV